MSPSILVSSLAFVAAVWIAYRLCSLSSSPHPPGPRRLPLFGNIFSTPRSKQWLSYSTWRKDYGDLIFLSGLGKHILVVNSMDDATELLEGRSSIYSDRPYLPMADLTGWSRAHTAFLPYGNLWRTHRRLLQTRFRKETVVQDRDVAIRASTQLLLNMLRSSDLFAEHYEHYIASMTMGVIYGRNDIPEDDPILAMVQGALRTLTESVISGSMLVNFIPQLRYLPEWLPGLGFKRQARGCQEHLKKMIDMPFETAKAEQANNTANSSWALDLLQRAELTKKSGTPEEGTEELLKNVTSAVFGAAVEASSTTLKVFIHAMILFPEARRCAQAEIDSIVCGERLPCFDDMAHMPYVAALCREVRRWRPVLPMGFPHVSISDDTYHGYIIPKGTMVFPNVWEMCHDDRLYDQPGKFMPERFLDTNGALVKDTVPAFGFGRRICPGRYLAEEMIWIAVASMLAAFDITKAQDEDGQEINVSEDDYSDGVTTAPLPFKYSITPRSDRWRSIVLATRSKEVSG